jgi:hypothetical protein
LAFSRGEQVIGEGEENRDLYILTRGSVSIKIHLPSNNRKKRLFTFNYKLSTFIRFQIYMIKNNRPSGSFCRFN